LILIALCFYTGFSILSSQERFVGCDFLAQLQLYLFYVLALNRIRTEGRLQQTVILLFVVLATQSAIYFIQAALGITFSLTGESRTAGELPRPGGTVATTPSGFSNFIVPILLIATAQFVASSSGGARAKWLAILLAMGIAALMLPVTRAQAAYVIGVAYWCVWVPAQAPVRKVAIGAAMLLAALRQRLKDDGEIESAPAGRSYNASGAHANCH
jgi:hypothetical protein